MEKMRERGRGKREKTRRAERGKDHLCSYEVGKMEEDGFNGAVGRVLRGWRRHQLGVALEEEVDLPKELVEV